MTAASFNEIFGLGTHSLDSSYSQAYLCQDNAANTTVAEFSGGTDATLGGGNTTAELTTTGPNSWLPAALNLDGSADYFSVSDDGGMQTAGTLIVWAKGTVAPTSQTTYTSLISHRIGGGSQRFSLVTRAGLTAGSMGYEWDGNDANYDTGFQYTQNSWQMHALVVTATDAKWYLDAVLQHTRTAANPSMDLTGATFYVGWDGAGAGRFWTGPVAFVSHFNREFVLSEIQLVKDGPNPINTSVPTLTITGTDWTGTVGSWDYDSPFAGLTVGGAITYTWQLRDASDDSVIDSGTGSSPSGSGLSAGSTYYLRIAASNGNGRNDSAADTNSANATVSLIGPACLTAVHLATPSLSAVTLAAPAVSAVNLAVPALSDVFVEACE